MLKLYQPYMYYVFCKNIPDFVYKQCAQSNFQVTMNTSDYSLISYIGTILDEGATHSPERFWYVDLYIWYVVYVLSFNVLYISNYCIFLVYK